MKQNRPDKNSERGHTEVDWTINPHPDLLTTPVEELIKWVDENFSDPELREILKNDIKSERDMLDQSPKDDKTSQE